MASCEDGMFTMCGDSVTACGFVEVLAGQSESTAEKKLGGGLSAGQ